MGVSRVELVKFVKYCLLLLIIATAAAAAASAVGDASTESGESRLESVGREDVQFGPDSRPDDHDRGLRSSDAAPRM